MDRLFTDPASGRRKFLDRLVVALEPSHTREIAAFEAAAAQRNRLLAEGGEAAWLTALEDSLARHAVAATATRLGVIMQINAGSADPFPRVTVGLDCPIATQLREKPALTVEDGLRATFAATRATDAAARTTTTGPHRADVLMADTASSRPAALSSTGQQKAMLLGIILTHAALVATLRGRAPILLLDEPLVHLDSAHRAALFAALTGSDFAAWLTGTDPETFATFDGAACHSIHNNTISHP
jgi:DNA replication and repair protein RecF